MTETLTFEERIKNMENQIALCWEMHDACMKCKRCSILMRQAVIGFNRKHDTSE